MDVAVKVASAKSTRRVVLKTGTYFASQHALTSADKIVHPALRNPIAGRLNAGTSAA